MINTCLCHKFSFEEIKMREAEVRKWLHTFFYYLKKHISLKLFLRAFVSFFFSLNNSQIFQNFK